MLSRQRVIEIDKTDEIDKVRRFIGKELDRHRARLGLNLRQFARHVDAPYSSSCRILTGTHSCIDSYFRNLEVVQCGFSLRLMLDWHPQQVGLPYEEPNMSSLDLGQSRSKRVNQLMEELLSEIRRSRSE